MEVGKPEKLIPMFVGPEGCNESGHEFTVHSYFSLFVSPVACLSNDCLVPEKIHTYPFEGHWKF